MIHVDRWSVQMVERPPVSATGRDVASADGRSAGSEVSRQAFSCRERDPRLELNPNSRRSMFAGASTNLYLSPSFWTAPTRLLDRKSRQSSTKVREGRGTTSFRSVKWRFSVLMYPSA